VAPVISHANVAFPHASIVNFVTPAFFPNIPLGLNHKPLLASVFMAIAQLLQKVNEPRIALDEVSKFVLITSFIKSPDASIAPAMVDAVLHHIVDDPVIAPVIVAEVAIKFPVLST
jgi:hypothetical protein